MKRLLFVVISLLLICSVSAGVIKTTDDQNSWKLEVPSFSGGSGSFPVFFAVDHISGKDFNYIAVCRNETGGEVNCRVQVGDGVKECIGSDVVVCPGSGSSDMITVSSGENDLFFRIPDHFEKKGIITIMNNPDLAEICTLSDNDTVCSDVDYYEVYVNGSSSVDYREYEWLLQDLDGVKDQFGSSVDKYVFTDSYVPGEGVLGEELYDINNSAVQLGGVVNAGFEDELEDWKIVGNWDDSEENQITGRVISLEDSKSGWIAVLVGLVIVAGVVEYRIRKSR